MATAAPAVARRYELQHKLGQGGMGEVYAAFDRLTGIQVALKRVLHMQPLTMPPTDSRDVRRTLAHEFRILTALRHPHIINVLDYGFDAERQPYYTMTLMEGARPITEAARAFTSAQRGQAFADMLQALAYLHRRGILHRDLKPANILVDATDCVKLLDFGLAAHERASGSTGTLAYMPPEILQQRGATPQSDLFSLGIIAYELFAQRHPFADVSTDKLIENLLRAEPDYDALPPQLRPIILRLMMKDPLARYPDAESALSDLAALSADPITIEDANVRESFLQAARFIGRETELNQLTGELERIIDNADHTPAGAAFLIEGESGVGKSRLLEELRTHALINGVLVLRGQCIAGSSTPFELWRDVLRRLLLEHDINDVEAGALREIIPNIGELLGRDVPSLPSLDVISARNRVIDTILMLFRRHNQPTLLILEDLHWGLESLIPLRRLLEQLTNLPLMIVGSYRTEEALTLPSQLPQMQRLPLERLTPAEVAALSEAMIGSAGAQQYIVNYLHKQSEGNVLFLIEVIRALADNAGNLGGIGTKTLPSNVFAGGIARIVARRLARLPAEAAPALQLAALAGRSIDEKLLAHLVGEHAERWLQAGIDAAIFEMVDGHCRFAHDRLRDAIIATIDPSDLPDLHRRIAEGLEALYPETRLIASALCEHWHAAGDAEKEAFYAAIVTDQRFNLGILSEAQYMLERALALQPQNLQVQLTLYKLAGGIYYDLGKPDISTEYYGLLLRLARSLNEGELEGAALEGLGSAAYQVSDFDAARTWLEDSLRLRRSINDQRGSSSSLNWLSVLHRFRGDYDASWEALQESLKLRRAINDQMGIARSLYQMSIHARNRGAFAEAIEYLHEASHFRRAAADGRGLGDDLNNLGLCYLLMHDYARARTALNEGLHTRETSDNQRGIASSQNSLGDLNMAEGNYGAAIRSYGSALGIWHKAQDRWNIANSYASLGYVQARMGEVLSARFHLSTSLALAREISAAFIILKVLIGFALLALHDGQPELAALLLGGVEQHPAMTAQLQQIYFAPVSTAFDLDAYAAEYALGAQSDLEALAALEFVQREA